MKYFGRMEIRVIVFFLAALLVQIRSAAAYPYGSVSVQASANSGVNTFQGSFAISGRGSYEVTIYYPSKSSGKPYPAVVFAHGLCSCAEWHTWIGNCLASNGYVALLFTVPNSTSTDVQEWVDGIEGGITYLEQLNNESGQLHGMVNVNRLGVMGHSMGAMAALIAASEDPRIKAVVSLAAPYLGDVHYEDEFAEEMRSKIDWDSVLSASRNLTKPVQFQIGTRDAFAANNTIVYYEATNSSIKELVMIEGGNHVQFLDDDLTLSPSTIEGLFSLLLSLGPVMFWVLMRYIGPKIVLVFSCKTLTQVPVVLGIDQPATITPQEQQEISSQNFLSFFNFYLS